jgi:hypothetical protein
LPRNDEVPRSADPVIVLGYSSYQFFQFLCSLSLFVGRVFQPLEKERTYEATDNSDSTAYQDWQQHVPQ